jgi:hypothetical protein
MGVNVCVGVGVAFEARASSSPTLLRYTSDHLPGYIHVQKYLRDFPDVMKVRWQAVLQMYNKIR